MEFKPSGRFTLSSWHDDRSTTAEGVLIPRAQYRAAKRARSYTRALIVPLLLVCGVLFGTALSGITTQNVASLPTALLRGVGGNENGWQGPVSALSQTNFYLETRTAFVAEAVSFLDINVTERQIRYFNEGVLVLAAPIATVPATDSWWYAPSGIYEVTTQEERLFSSFGQFYQPWAIRFAENYVVHGAPELPDGSALPTRYSDGGIRLSNTDAERLYQLLEPGTVVLLHNQITVEKDEFILDAPVSGVSASEYLVFDTKSNTALVASDAQAPVPIASITKLMTALVAAETLDLDASVQVPGDSGVSSMVPRLRSRNSVSMYTLLQLLLVESSNEAAEVIAGELGREEFIERMNDVASRLRLSDTTFADSSGLSAENISTARDLVTLITYIEQHHPFILTLTREADLPAAYRADEFPNLINFNRLPTDSTFIGGKVGETNAAGQTSVSLHTVPLGTQERTVVVVVLGASERSDDIAQLLQYVIDRAAPAE